MKDQVISDLLKELKDKKQALLSLNLFLIMSIVNPGLHDHEYNVLSIS